MPQSKADDFKFGHYPLYACLSDAMPSYRKSPGVILPIVSFNSFASLSPANAICLSTTLISRW
jgi:hypothetical protein